jgi:hypothetical protein
LWIAPALDGGKDAGGVGVIEGLRTVDALAVLAENVAAHLVQREAGACAEPAVDEDQVKLGHRVSPICCTRRCPP